MLLGLGFALRSLLLQGLSHFLNACAFDEVWQLKGGLLNAPFALKVLALKTPVAWHRDGVPGGLEVDQELGVLCRHVMHLHNIRPGHQLLEFCHSKTIHSEQLLHYHVPCDRLLFLLIITAVIVRRTDVLEMTLGKWV